MFEVGPTGVIGADQRRLMLDKVGSIKLGG